MNGSLNLSRAFGDMEFKRSSELSPAQQMITANPEVRTLQLQRGDEFLILACDGIWDVLTNQAVSSVACVVCRLCLKIERGLDMHEFLGAPTASRFELAQYTSYIGLDS